MGNCQAVDAAALVIQHPNGKLERMYWPVTASEVMKTNPGHYVSLIIPLPAGSKNDDDQVDDDDKKTVRFTRVKLLRPTDTLVLGRAYRLVTTQEVMKVLRAKKHAKMMMRRDKPESAFIDDYVKINSNKENYKDIIMSSEKGRSMTQDNQGLKPDIRHRQNNLVNGKPKSWRPSLQSISESNGNI